MARVLRRGTVWVFQEGEQKKVQGERGSGHSARDEKGRQNVGNTTAPSATPSKASPEIDQPSFSLHPSGCYPVISNMKSCQDEKEK